MATSYPLQSCHECENEAAGRCPSCHHHYCMEHFPRHNHKTCAQHMATHAEEYVCYVCGDPVVPEQWSTAVFAHYVDSHTCAGCNRYICEDHTARKDEQVKIPQDGLRHHRYNTTVRLCDLCVPTRAFGGLIGATWWVAGLATVLLTGWFVFRG